MSERSDRAWRYVFYKSLADRVPVREFIEEQEAVVQRSIRADLRRLVEVNVRLVAPYARKLEGRDFWELRTRVAGDIYRTFYFARTGRKFVLLHAFQKKSQRTPVKELDTAEARMKDYLERNRKRRKGERRATRHKLGCRGGRRGVLRGA